MAAKEVVAIPNCEITVINNKIFKIHPKRFPKNF